MPALRLGIVSLPMHGLYKALQRNKPLYAALAL